jgi:hypothetical protein
MRGIGLGGICGFTLRGILSYSGRDECGKLLQYNHLDRQQEADAEPEAEEEGRQSGRQRSGIGLWAGSDL